MQHGNIEFASPEYFLSNSKICQQSETKLDGNCDHYADMTLVHGDKIKELLVKFGGYSKDRVQVVGNPQWDIILKTEHFDKTKFLQDIGFNEKIKTIVILSQALPIAENRLFFDNNVTETLSKSFSDYQIIWKPHPREDVLEISKLVKDKHKLTKAIITKDLPLFDVIHAGDVAITVHSTAGLEAMLFDKPVITFIPPGELENNLFKDTGAVIKAETKKELTTAIDQALHDDSVKKKLKLNREKLIQSLAKFDGNASKTVAKIITQMIYKK
jgi:UDP-N-acetylglucosamine 2-epimerase